MPENPNDSISEAAQKAAERAEAAAGVLEKAGHSNPFFSTARNTSASNFRSRRSQEHLGAFNFRVEIEGLDVGGFRSVEGLQVKVESITYHQSKVRMPLKRPGRPEVGNIRLIKGYVNSDLLWRWCEQIRSGKIQRKSGSIVLLDDAGHETCRYNFFNAWPTQWSGFKLDGKGSEVLVEELELVVEHIERAGGTGFSFW